MANGFSKCTVDCGKHSNNVYAVFNHIKQAVGINPCMRQDVDCPPDELSAAIGTRFIQFFNVPKHLVNLITEAANEALETLKDAGVSEEA